MTEPSPAAPFHVMAKPIGPACNLDCKYCFYLEKEKLYPRQENMRMTEPVLESFIRQYIECNPVQADFAWQGGEPTLMGVAFFRKVVELQKRHRRPGQAISNALQTNGTLLDDEWCEFLAGEGFLVGISMDGPERQHDRYRVDKSGRGTFGRVRNGLECLLKHKVQTNALVVVNAANADHPVEVYRSLRGMGIEYLQFIPVVERSTGEELAAPPGSEERKVAVTPWSVEAVQWGKFLCGVFDEWYASDIGRGFVMFFEEQLGILAGRPATTCVFAPTCGRAMALEHNGDLYACDHYVYPNWRLGNLMETPLSELAALPAQRDFGLAKATSLPAMCRECSILPHCRGECPKHRFLVTPAGEPGLNYLCAGYRMFHRHARARMVQVLNDMGVAPVGGAGPMDNP